MTILGYAEYRSGTIFRALNTTTKIFRAAPFFNPISDPIKCPKDILSDCLLLKVRYKLPGGAFLLNGE
jgi:hypothetical protein